MPAGRPRKPAGSGESAPTVSVRLTAEDEAALNVIRFDGAFAEGRTRRLSPAEATRLAWRELALRMAGPERVERASALMIKKRRRDDSR